jgi:Uma2 family endonuclease
MAHDGAPALGRYTSDEYLALAEHGVLEPDDRVELLDGVVVSMSPINPPHAVATDKVAVALRAAFGKGFAVRVQHPLRAGRRSVPQPDVAVVAGDYDDYVGAHPTSAVLVVEVADSTLAQDRLTKAAIYAGAGVPQYLIVDLRDGWGRGPVGSRPDPAHVREAADRAAGRHRRPRRQARRTRARE